MITIRGTFDGRIFRALPGEPIPEVEREVPVRIEFADDEPDLDSPERLLRRREAARKLLAARAAMPPWDVNIKDLVEEGRER